MPKTPAAICHRCLVSTANDIKWADVWNTTCHMLSLQFTPSPFQWQFSTWTWVSQLSRGCFPLHLLEKTILGDKRHRIFTGRMPILSPNQRRQSTEGNSKHWTNQWQKITLGPSTWSVQSQRHHGHCSFHAGSSMPVPDFSVYKSQYPDGSLFNGKALVSINVVCRGWLAILSSSGQHVLWMFDIYFIITSLISETHQWQSAKTCLISVAWVLVYNLGLTLGGPSQFLQGQK